MSEWVVDGRLLDTSAVPETDTHSDRREKCTVNK
jgi:hypothetical protein